MDNLDKNGLLGSIFGYKEQKVGEYHNGLKQGLLLS